MPSSSRWFRSATLSAALAAIVSLGAAPASGETLLGAQLELPTGVSAVGKHGVGSWIVLDLYAGHRFGRRKQYWTQLRAPVVMMSPGALDTSLLGGLDAELRTPVNRSLGVVGRLGWLRPGFLGVSPFSLPTSFYVGGLQVGVALGVTLTYKGEKSRLVAEPTLSIQRSSAAVVVGNTRVSFAQATAQLPLSAFYKFNPKFEGAFLTGAYLGPNLTYKPDQGLAVPAILDGTYAVGEATRFGFSAGVANAVPSTGSKPLDTLYFALRLEQTLGGAPAHRETTEDDRRKGDRDANDRSEELRGDDDE